jgi:hypothetical protein
MEPPKKPAKQGATSPGVKDLPNTLSRRNRTRVLGLESTYRNQMVKHEPETHTEPAAAY